MNKIASSSSSTCGCNQAVQHRAVRDNYKSSSNPVYAKIRRFNRWKEQLNVRFKFCNKAQLFQFNYAVLVQCIGLKLGGPIVDNNSIVRLTVEVLPIQQLTRSTSAADQAVRLSTCRCVAFPFSLVPVERRFLPASARRSGYWQVNMHLSVQLRFVNLSSSDKCQAVRLYLSV